VIELYPNRWHWERDEHRHWDFIMKAKCVWEGTGARQNEEKEAELSQRLTSCYNTILDKLIAIRLVK
jgi:hypothetical protein